MQTYLKYMYNSNLFEDESLLQEIITLDNGLHAFILNETIFYPKGGGQPCDIGEISQNNITIKISDVQFAKGKVLHIEDSNSEQSLKHFEIGTPIQLKVNKDRRILHSKLHTASHLIDDALYILGYTNFVATKGYSYPDSPYVEYTGELIGITKEILINNIEEKINSIIKEGFNIKTLYVERENISKYCYDSMVNNQLEDKPYRVIVTYGSKGIPCGGTHVNNISEVEHVKIRKITAKKGNIRISYNL